MTKWQDTKSKKNGSHLKTVSQNDQKSNQHILGAYVHIHTKYEVSMTQLFVISYLKRSTQITPMTKTTTAGKA